MNKQKNQLTNNNKKIWVSFFFDEEYIYEISKPNLNFVTDGHKLKAICPSTFFKVDKSYIPLSINAGGIISLDCEGIIFSGVYNMSRYMRFPTMWFVQRAKPQISLIRAFA